jgi:hypothetical protein
MKPQPSGKSIGHAPARAPLSLLLPGALVFAFFLGWLFTPNSQIDKSDFFASYASAWLLRMGRASQLYNQPLQVLLHGQFTSPDAPVPFSPFFYPPSSLLLYLPFTFLSFHLSYRLWGLLQLICLALASVMALRATPEAQRLAGFQKASVLLIALALPATAELLLVGQFDAFPALGLALGYACFRRGWLFRAGFIPASLLLCAKPHLALALLAFLIGYRSWRPLLGFIAAGLLVFLAGLIAGSGAWIAFIHHLLAPTTLATLDWMSNLSGLAGALVGNTKAGYAAGLALTLVGLGFAVYLGHRVRHRRAKPGAVLAGVVALMLLTSIHAFSYDLGLLIPAFVWVGIEIKATFPAKYPCLVGFWMLLGLADFFVNDVNSHLPFIPGGFVIPFLLLAGMAGALHIAASPNP